MGRKLDALDNVFLHLESAATPMHVGGLLVFSPADGLAGRGRERHEIMRRAPVEAEPFNQRLRPGRLLGSPSWQTVTDVDLTAHLRLHELHEGSPRDLMERVSAIHGRRMERERPMWTCDVFDGLAGGRYAYFYRVHHACIDGISAIRRMQNGLSGDPEGETPPLWAQAPTKRRPRRVPTGSSYERALKAARTNVGVVREIVDALRETAGARGSVEPRAAVPFTAPRIAMNEPIVSGERSVAWQRLPLEAMRAVGKAAGATINDVLLALVAGVLRADLMKRGELPDAPLVSMVPFSLRDLSDDGSGSNRLSCLLCDLGTDRADPVERLQTIIGSARDGKRMLRQMSADAAAAYALAVMFPGIVATVLGIYGRLPRIPFNTVVSNVPGPREPLYDGGAPLQAIYPISLLYDRQGINFTVISYEGELDLGLVATRQAVPDATAMADAITAELDVLHRAVVGQGIDGVETARQPK
jgi:diacylglycerol O-acyltransferase / wax synthase